MTCPYFSLRLFTEVRRSSYGPMAFSVLAFNEEVKASTGNAIGPYENLLTSVKRRKMKATHRLAKTGSRLPQPHSTTCYSEVKMILKQKVKADQLKKGHKTLNMTTSTSCSGQSKPQFSALEKDITDLGKKNPQKNGLADTAKQRPRFPVYKPAPILRGYAQKPELAGNQSEPNYRDTLAAKEGRSCASPRRDYRVIKLFSKTACTGARSKEVSP